MLNIAPGSVVHVAGMVVMHKAHYDLLMKIKDAYFELGAVAAATADNIRIWRAEYAQHEINESASAVQAGGLHTPAVAQSIADSANEAAVAVPKEILDFEALITPRIDCENIGKFTDEVHKHYPNATFSRGESFEKAYYKGTLVGVFYKFIHKARILLPAAMPYMPTEQGPIGRL